LTRLRGALGPPSSKLCSVCAGRLYDGFPVVRGVKVSSASRCDTVMLATYATCSADEVAVPPMTRLASQYALVLTRIYAALEYAPDHEVVERSGERYREDWLAVAFDLCSARPVTRSKHDWSFKQRK
jgi:hypothetical protein